MRQKKSNFLYYIIAAAVIVALGFVIIHEVPVSSEHIEEVIK